MFLNEYLMFLFKTLTIVVGIVSIIIVYFYSKVKLKHGKSKGLLIIKDLSNSYHRLKIQMLSNLYAKDKVKEEIRKYKKLTKDNKKKLNRLNTYIIKFNGNIKATAVESLKEEITAIISVANKKDNVVLVLESPGGTVSGYGLAASELSRIKKKGIKLTIIVDKVAASGGYMMACMANKIIAAPFAIIGSIGVISQTPNFHRLLKDKGVEFEQITSGKYKRTVTMFGNNTEEDREKLKSELGSIHEQFKGLIKTQRPGIDIEKVSTGEYWLGEKAKELKLVDELMTSEEYLMSIYESGSNLYRIEYKKKETLMNKLSIASNHIRGIFSTEPI